MLSTHIYLILFNTVQSILLMHELLHGQVNLAGGYYDAGDNVKFGLPMAYTVTMLSWAATDFRKEMASLNQMGHNLEAIKWGTDYFIKAHTHPYVLWGQVQFSSLIPTILDRDRERSNVV